MIKSLYILLCATVVIPLLTSCRINNGDIGPLYGAWALTAMEVDGEPYTAWSDDGHEWFFQFQNNIVLIMETTPLHDYTEHFGTWEWVKEDTEIALNYTHTSNDYNEPGTGYYTPPAGLLLTEPVVYTFNVSWTDERHFVWTTVNTEGQRLTYHLKQTY